MTTLNRWATIAGAAWLLSIAGCMSVQTVRPGDLRAPHPWTRVWVTDGKGTTTVYEEAHVEGETLVGIANGKWEHVHLTDDLTLRTREVSTGRTALIGVGIGAVLLGGVFLLVQSGFGDNSSPPKQ